MKALIAIAGRPVETGGVKDWPLTTAVAMPGTYAGALHAAGGREAVMMPTEIGADDARRIIERFDGLLLIGGGDILPARYGAQPQPEVYGTSVERDSFEIALLEAALELDMPTLAICRGIQVLNVALGGTLHQHITDREGPIRHGFNQKWATHDVSLEAGSLVAKTMGAERAACPSHHHQALDRVAEGLIPVGWSEDGVIEAVEMQGRWTIGVQWHPEMSATKDPAQQSLFDELVNRAAAFRSAAQEK